MQNITQIRFDHGAVDHVARLCRERMNFMRLQRRMKGITFKCFQALRTGAFCFGLSR